MDKQEKKDLLDIIAKKYGYNTFSSEEVWELWQKKLNYPKS